MHCSLGLQPEGVQVAIQIAYKHPPFCHRRPAKKDRARSGIGVSEETVAICCIEQIDLGPLCYYYYTVNHCDRTEHRPVVQAVLPERGSCQRIERSHAAFAFGPIDGRIASSHVEGRAVPGTGRDATITARRTVSAVVSNSDLPDRSGTEMHPVERVVDAILVREADEVVSGRPRGDIEDGRRGAEILIPSSSVERQAPGVDH